MRHCRCAVAREAVSSRTVRSRCSSPRTSGVVTASSLRCATDNTDWLCCPRAQPRSEHIYSQTTDISPNLLLVGGQYVGKLPQVLRAVPGRGHRLRVHGG